ncbi:MAG TPA: UDP-N-acetylmuramoyl-tripeptide--D-alanyl-D-alanine ligase [Bacillota bacterium]|nr:UDP-N-acetylmuramoyl-tripeptide--D-alanyl-D-alanine ligase [Bacillota bacterium]
MEVLRIEEIVKATLGKLVNPGEGLKISGVSIDSRSINVGDMFIALKGESFDGHDFIDSAAKKGAALIIAQKPLSGCSTPYILVKDTYRALQDIAGYHRNKFKIPFVAVTGSSGKTTTKDMIASVLSQKYKVLKTEGNFNNAIGMPLTLLGLRPDHEIAVLEMGMNSPGEIRLLSDIVRQDVGVITNVGIAHIEKLGSRENILKAKLEIFSFFNKNNTAVINGDNDMLSRLYSEKYRVIKYGLDKDNDIYAYAIEEKGEEGINFSVDLDNVKSDFCVMLPGMHNVYNALSAIAVARLFDMEAESIKEGLKSFRPSKMRMDIMKLRSGIRLVSDVYNANPESMKAAIDALCSLKSEGKNICVLGDMLELGDISGEEHYKIAMYAASSGINILIAAGNFSDDMKKGWLASGMGSNSIFAFSSVKEAAGCIEGIARPGDTVLVKGSRGMKMEYIVDYLCERG